MSGRYGPVPMNFAPLASLGDTFLDARDRAQKRTREQEVRRTLASLADGQADVETAGRRLLSLGDVQRGLGLMKLGQKAARPVAAPISRARG
jgi:hypothetical protein